MNLARLARLGFATTLLTVAACANESADGTQDDSEDLTSVTARSRQLEFVGTVYVDKDASADAIMQAVRREAQTAFGPMRTVDIAVQSRELKDIDPTTFVKRAVKVVDPNVATDKGTDMLEVKYTYRDSAIVGLRYTNRTTAPLALMNPSYTSQLQRLLVECTTNDDEAKEFLQGTAWYVFQPSLAQCATAMKKEQTAIDADRTKLADPAHQVAKSDVNRLYLPITAKLGADKTNKGKSYPEYQKLYAGGVQKNKLVVSLVFGNIDHVATGGPSSDFNWPELMATLGEVMDAGGELKQVPLATDAGTPAVDLTSFTLKSGKKIANPSFKDLVALHDGSSSLGLSYADSQDLEAQFGDRIFRKWFAVERTVSVKSGSAAAHDVGVQFLVYFGAESDGAPHHYATKNSDVFLYNGHSYIGYGPLDPSNFTAADFPKSYQILWIDGCVSYNYYEKDYIPLKDGGTKNLDLVTNGIEAPAWHSGHAMGQWLIGLLNGKNTSYKDLLLAAADTEALRVVDGELDNEFTPTKFPMTITPR